MVKKTTDEAVIEWRAQMAKTDPAQRWALLESIAQTLHRNPKYIRSFITGQRATHLNDQAPPVVVSKKATPLRRVPAHLVIEWRAKTATTPKRDRTALFEVLARESGFNINTVRAHILGVKSKTLNHKAPPIRVRTYLSKEQLDALIEQYRGVRKTTSLFAFSKMVAPSFGLKPASIYTRIRTRHPEFVKTYVY